VIHHAGIDERAQRVGQHHVALGDELVTQAAIARVEVHELVGDHGGLPLAWKTTRCLGCSAFETSTSRGTFSATFHARRGARNA
jgi:hypothetical protein